MSIANTDLVAYGSLSRPTDDTSIVGGGIDVTMRPIFTQLAANAIIEVVSDGADTRTVTIVGRDSTGAAVTSSITLNGVTPVDGAQTYERLLSVTLSGVDAARTVTVKQGAGGSTISTIPPNEKGFYTLFDNSSSTSSIETRYEKVFWRNNNSTFALLNAQLELTVDASGTINIGLEAAVDDTNTAANRLTAPAGVAFSGLSTPLNVPGTNLGPGHAIGVWLKQTLAANQVPQKVSFTVQMSGQTA